MSHLSALPLHQAVFGRTTMILVVYVHIYIYISTTCARHVRPKCGLAKLACLSVTSRRKKKADFKKYLGVVLDI